MKLKVKVDADSGSVYIAAIDPETGEHRKSATLTKGEEVNLDLDTVTSADEISFGDVVVSDPGPSDGGGTPEEPPAGSGDQGGDAGGDQGGGEAPAGSGDQGGDSGSGDAGSGEAPDPSGTNSGCTEKALYLVEGEQSGAATLPEGFEASGLETPDGKTLYHYGSDTPGQKGTGNVDGVSIYADADDNEKPVQPASPPAEEQSA